MSDETRTHIRLFTLVILAFLPAVVLYALTNSRLQETERLRQEDRLVELTRLTTAEYRRLVTESRQLLTALAEFPVVRDAVEPECSERLAAVLEHTPQHTTVSVIGGDGYLACGSLRADGPLYLGDRAYYLLATTQGRFQVGEYATGRITGKPTVGVALPVGEGGSGQLQRVLAASLDLTTLGQHAGLRELPPATTLTILDRSGTVLLRRPARSSTTSADTVGAWVPQGFPALDGTNDAVRLVEGMDLDDVTRLFAVAPLTTTGDRTPEGFVVLGKDQASILAEVEEVARRELQLLAVGGLLVLLLAWLFGHYGLVRARAAPDPAGA